jgi:hypothetical protein
MARKLTIAIEAKNALKAGIGKALASFKSFGAGIKKFAAGGITVLKNMGKALIGIGAAATAAAAVTIKAFAVQEKAEVGLEAALTSRIVTARKGTKLHERQTAQVANLTKHYQKEASAIQDLTAIGDENVLTLQAQLLQQGVMPKQLNQATKATLGLAKALNIRERSAVKMVAEMAQGNTMLVNSAAAEVKAASESEKLSTALAIAGRGYSQIKAELDTVTGRTEEFKGRLGDLAEGVGKAVSGGVSFKETLAKMSQKILEFQNSENFTKITDNIKGALTSTREFFTLLTSGPEGKKEALGNLKLAADELIAKLKVGAGKFGDAMFKALEVAYKKWETEHPFIGTVSRLGGGAKTVGGKIGSQAEDIVSGAKGLASRLKGGKPELTLKEQQKLMRKILTENERIRKQQDELLTMK